MKQCPRCHRTYADDLNFCLEDGGALHASLDDEATWVSPQPIPPPGPIPPGPVPQVPPPQPQSQRKGWTAFGVIGTILVALIWGGIKLALWSADHENHTTQSAASPSPAYVYYSSPGSSPVPPCTVLNNCPSPSPTPTETPRPSPAPSPSPTIAEPVERSLSLGSYQSERTIESEGHATLLKLKLILYSDGTYLEQGYVTFRGTGISDLLGLEEKGSVSQAKDQLIFRDRLERKFDMEEGSWSAWTTARGGSSIRQQIRNVTATTFQMYDNDEKAWYTFSKP